MRRLAIATCAVIVVGVAGVAPAVADTATVTGTGSYQKLVINNGNSNLTFKLRAPGGGCTGAKYLAVNFRDRDGTKYTMDGGCYGIDWATSISRAGTLVDCPDFRLRYSADKSTWTGVIPRTCLKRLGSAIKVTDSWVDDYSPNVNEVPASRYVAQG